MEYVPRLAKALLLGFVAFPVIVGVFIGYLYASSRLGFRQNEKQRRTIQSLMILSSALEKVHDVCGAYPAGFDGPLGENCAKPGTLVLELVEGGELAAIESEDHWGRRALCDDWGGRLEYGALEVIGCAEIATDKIPPACIARFGAKWSEHAIFLSRGRDGRIDIGFPRCGPRGLRFERDAKPAARCKPPAKALGAPDERRSFDPWEFGCDLVFGDEGQIISFPEAGPFCQG